MYDVTVKTTGYLIGEYITITLKAKYAKDEDHLREANERIIVLEQALRTRIPVAVYQSSTYQQLFNTLKDALIACWTAQETVMDSLDPLEVYLAAKTTLIENKKRNEAIRALDTFFNEGYYSHLEKTYRI